jgi:asparagine N-glycosylation enzyme membrane subunit Stt3
MNPKLKYFLYGVFAIPSLFGLYSYFKNHSLTLVFLIAFMVLIPLIQMLRGKKNSEEKNEKKIK